MKLIYLLLAILTISGCKEQDDPAPTEPPVQTVNYKINTDKARYEPGSTVSFTIDPAVPSGAVVRYKYLNTVVAQENINGSSWEWSAPADDFRGYMAEVVTEDEETETVIATVGFDVSSDWTKFPRYGFLSKFPDMNEAVIASVIDNLNKHHINGLQFYDWHYKHHQPLAGTPENPDPVYRDIINREIYFSTVEQYIGAAHERDMKAMFYNLIFGALDDAQNDGVELEWYLYTDKNHSNKDKHPLPQPPFISDIFLLNPANLSWQEYLIRENNKVYEALPFDGFHMDQLGHRGKTLYTYHGSTVDLATTYKPFIEAMKTARPDKDVVLNAVNQYGQEGIAVAPTGFLYTEVWGPNDTYEHLANLIKENNNLSSGTKNTVLAAYMNYDLANNTGYFNTPAVLLTDAVIFAFGGSHLELGEHMLGKEYFPNSNLQMKDDLKRSLVKYYDFLVAYQNLLRDGGSFNNPVVTSLGQITLNSWPAQTGKVSVVGKEIDNRQVIHLINFSNANTLNWRDNAGMQPYPQEIKNIRLSFSIGRPVAKVWFASPDINGGASVELEFNQNSNGVSFTIPALEYWDMIVVEYQ